MPENKVDIRCFIYASSLNFLFVILANKSSLIKVGLVVKLKDSTRRAKLKVAIDSNHCYVWGINYKLGFVGLLRLISRGNSLFFLAARSNNGLE